MIATFAATTQIPLQQAIFVGAGLSIVLFAVQVASRGRIVELVPTDDGADFRVAEVPTALPSGRTTVLHYVGTGFFAEVNRLEEEWPHTAGTHDAGLVVSLRGSAGIPSTTFLKSLDRLIDRWHARGVEVVLCGVPDDLRRRLDTGGVTDRLTGAILSDAGGVLTSVREAYDLVESRRRARAATEGDPGGDVPPPRAERPPRCHRVAMASESKPPAASIVDQQQAVRDSLPFSDTQDFEDATRGLIGRRQPNAVTADDGTVLWDNDTYAYLDGDAPDSVNPSLWRQSRLNAIDGLFEVVPGIYQVRGMDLSNTTFVEGDEGVVVIDTLLSVETGAAALALYREHRGDRPVKAVVYTHSHADHFGGTKGFVSPEDVEAGRVRVFAPEGFLEHAVSENVYAGVAMNRRAGYMYGAALARGPQGQVGAGLGQTLSVGEVSLVPPTDTISTTGHEEVVDGVRLVFQMAPGTEAPSEMLIYLPDFQALCAAEDATHTLHNLLTLRGAVVRDPHAWARYLTETIDLFGDVEVVFASHHWPTWGRERVVKYLQDQRDIYAYLHDQTLRMLNQGLTGPEIAEEITLPPALENAWNARGYYGSVSHNVKAIYQRYLGWFDGNPAHLWEHPPVERAKRYVELGGGADAVVEAARAAYDAGDFRWVAELVNHVVFAEPDHAAARELLADTYEQLGYGAENGTWRDFFLSGATELRDGQFGTPTETNAPDVIANLSPEMLFDALAIQVNGPLAWDEKLTVDVVLTDTGDRYRLRLAHGVLTYSAAPQRGEADATLTASKQALPVLAMGGLPPEKLAAVGIELSGDPAVLGRLVAVLEPGDKDFAIVTP
ncbi:alkyl sulfatase dimerization domain-containing protein [Isoptericola halotolerans]